MARPSRNGVAERGVKTPRDTKVAAGAGRPIGNAPKDFAPDERAAWNAIVAECPWVDMTHRRWVRGLALTAARVDRITNYFKKRQAEFKKRKEDTALAYLDDSGKRHPLMTDLLAAEESLRKSLSALGASPAAQVKMMSDIGNGNRTVELDAARKRYFE